MSRSAIIVSLLAAALASGCKQEVLCPPLDSCGGGMPVGDWALAPDHPSCSEDLYTPPPDPRLTAGDVPPARTPVPEPALYDWCFLLVTGPGLEPIVPAGTPRFVAESPPIGAATIHYDANLTYTLSTDRTGTYTLDFPAFCIRAFGAMDGKPADAKNDPNGPPVGVCKQIEAQLIRQTAMKNIYRNHVCDPSPADPQGCVCRFDLVETETSMGTYSGLNGSTMVHLPGTNFPEKVTYCLQGDRLQLTGTDGAYLFDRLGLRTLDLVRTTPPAPPTP